MQVIRTTQPNKTASFHSVLQADRPSTFQTSTSPDTFRIRFGQTLSAANTARLTELESQIDEMQEKLGRLYTRRDSLENVLKCLSDAMAGKKHLLVEILFTPEEQAELANSETRAEALNQQLDRTEEWLNLEELSAAIKDKLDLPVDWERAVHHLPLGDKQTVDDWLTPEQQQRWGRLLRALSKIQGLKDWSDGILRGLEKEKRLWEGAARGEAPRDGERPLLEQAQFNQSRNQEVYQQFLEDYQRYQALLATVE